MVLHNKILESLHFKIPDSEARCNSCGNVPSSEDEWIIGTVATSFCKSFKTTSFKLSYGPACKINKQCGQGTKNDHYSNEKKELHEQWEKPRDKFINEPSKQILSTQVELTTIWARKTV